MDAKMRDEKVEHHGSDSSTGQEHRNNRENMATAMDPRGDSDTEFLAAVDPELVKSVNRKFDLHILPWLFGMWCVGAEQDGCRRIRD